MAGTAAVAVARVRPAPAIGRSVVVVGDEEFCARVRVLGHAGATTRWVLPAQLVGQAPTLSRRHELLVDPRSFKALHDALPHLFDLARRVQVGHTGGGPGTDAASNLLSVPERAFKRILDVVVALALLILTLPVLIVAAIGIKLDSPGPVLYRHTRIGARGRGFRCYKLRTMRAATEAESQREYVEAMIRCQANPENGLFKRASDPRITRVGRYLRRLSIDELPQLWNVLAGDMSVVGPRPPVLAEAAVYGDTEWQRLQMKPGLTGLAQLRGRSGLRFDQIVASDLEYARTWSPLLELKILARTPRAVLSGRGAV